MKLMPDTICVIVVMYGMFNYLVIVGLCCCLPSHLELLIKNSDIEYIVRILVPYSMMMRLKLKIKYIINNMIKIYRIRFEIL